MVRSESLLGALLLAGELECGVADCDPEAARSCELFTDQLANALLACKPAASNNSNSQNSDFHS